MEGIKRVTYTIYTKTMKKNKEEIFYEFLTIQEKKKLKIKEYKKGDIIVSIENLDFFYFVLEGQLQIYKNLEALKLTSSPLLSKGYLIGGFTLLLNKKISGDLIVVTETAKIVEIEPDIIKRLKEENLEFNSYLFNMIVKYEMEVIETLTVKAFTGTKGIVAYYLLKMSKNGYVYIQNYHEIINQLNISNNGFYNTLNRFIEDKLIEKSKNSIKILKPQKIEKIYIDFLN